jgi:hypothetical protein
MPPTKPRISTSSRNRAPSLLFAAQSKQRYPHVEVQIYVANVPRLQRQLAKGKLLLKQLKRLRITASFAVQCPELIREQAEVAVRGRQHAPCLDHDLLQQPRAVLLPPGVVPTNGELGFREQDVGVAGRHKAATQLQALFMTLQGEVWCAQAVIPVEILQKFTGGNSSSRTQRPGCAES